MAVLLHLVGMSEASTSYSLSTARRAVTRRPSCLALHHRRLARSFAFADSGQCLQTQEPICSLKKERKKLAKSLKSHRKRLERLLKSTDNNTNQETLTEVFNELRRVQLLLDSKNSQLSELAAAESTSSDSSDSDDDCKPRIAAVHAPSTAGFNRARVLAMAAVLEPPVLLDVDALTPGTYDVPGRVVVCQGSKCRAKGAADVLRAVSQLASESQGIEIIPCKCIGKCGEPPAMRVKAENRGPALYTRLELSQLPDIMQQQFAGDSSAGLWGV